MRAIYEIVYIYELPLIKLGIFLQILNSVLFCFSVERPSLCDTEESKLHLRHNFSKPGFTFIFVFHQTHFLSIWWSELKSWFSIGKRRIYEYEQFLVMQYISIIIFRPMVKMKLVTSDLPYASQHFCHFSLHLCIRTYVCNQFFLELAHMFFSEILLSNKN